MKRTYYYKVIELAGVPPLQDEGDLNVFGRGGYELVAVIQAPDSSSQKPKRLDYLKYIEKMDSIPSE